MKDRITTAVIILLCILLFSFNATATSITDLNDGDQNRIVDFDTMPYHHPGISEPMPPGVSLVISEEYNETYLTPYPSPSGYAIVNESDGFFDIVVTLDATDQATDEAAPFSNVWNLWFDINYGAPYIWSDYHFEFWDENFGARLDFPIVQWYYLLSFDEASWHDSMFDLWSPLGEFDYLHVELRFKPSDIIFANGIDLGDQQTFSFGIRQVATTTSVPEPATMLLLGSGLIGLAGFRRRFRKK